jgi:antitoxin component YwqK of YwqJK toxin-antitoxin module
MGIKISALVSCLLALSSAGFSAENMVFKSGEELKAEEIIPAGRVLRVKGAMWWREVRKKDLTPEQEARYFSAGDGLYFSFTTMEVAGNQEYTYFYNGKYAGSRLTDPDGAALYHKGSVPDGVYREFFPGDTVKKEQTIAGNLRNGPSRSYFQDGGLEREVWFLDDVPNGFYRLFDSRGNLISEVRFIRGKRVWGDTGRQAEKAASGEKPQASRKKT